MSHNPVPPISADQSPQGKHPVLVVDLDETLCRTDTLHETLLRLLAQNPHKLVALGMGISAGKPAFKAAVADQLVIAADSLVYNDDVIAMIKAARAQGQRVALVSASDIRVVQAVADHLALFDEVHGTKGADDPNLSGQAKADFLTDRFGPRGFDYIGDCAVDLPVWQQARQAYAVRPNAALTTKAQNAGVTLQPVPEKTPQKPAWRVYAKALRPHQWSKNILVFLPVLAGQDLSHIGLVIWAFILFSLTASSVYLLNDLVDLSADRAHPRKSRRPFAAGAIPIATGAAMSAGLLVFAALMSLVVMPWLFSVALALYFAVTLAYSFILKRKMMVDVVTLAGLYTMRIVAGGAAAQIMPSPWFLAFSVFLFFGLAAIKRQAELVDQIKRGKQSSPGRAYMSDDVTVMQIMAISSGQSAVLIFALYLYSPDVAALYRTPEVLWLICPLLLYWLSRIAVLTHRGHMHDDPIVFAAKDKISYAVAGSVLLILALSELIG